jgi:hypothetical protein
MKMLLINWVFYLPAGHVAEALQHTYGYYLANKDHVEISLVLNAQSPTDLARACPWIARVYEVSLAEVVEHKEQAPCLQSIPRVWDYVITDPRVKPERMVAGWDEEDLIATQAVLQPFFQARLWSGYSLGWENDLFGGGYLDQRTIGQDTSLAYRVNPHLRLPVPAAAREFVQRYQHAGLKLCILPVSTAGLAQSPSPRAWEQVCAAFAEAFPGVRMYITGITYLIDEGRRVGFDFGPEDARRIAAQVPGVEECFDIGMWNQLALMEQCDLFCSPHTGFAFFSQMVGTPWLTIAGCPWGEWLFNGVPFYSAFPDCPNYLAGSDRETECWKRWIACEQVRCMEDANVVKRIPGILAGARLLLDPTFTYERAMQLHIEKRKALDRARE